MTGMWGLHLFKDLQRAMSGWHSSETAKPVKRCINRMLENQQNDFTAQKLFQTARYFVWYADKMLRSPGEIIDILRKIFTAVTANKEKTTVSIDKAKQYLDKTKERPSEILNILVSRRPSKDSLVCLCTILLVLFMVIKNLNIYTLQDNPMWIQQKLNDRSHKIEQAENDVSTLSSSTLSSSLSLSMSSNVIKTTKR